MKRKVFRYTTYKRFSESDFELTSKLVFPPRNTSSRAPDASEPVHSIRSACNSVQRAHKALYDVLRCNQWSFFITLTFGDPERVNDQYCIDQFSKWRKEVRRKFPSMYYVAVPEYHDRGSIHYHVVVGGVSSSDLGFIDSGRVLHHGKAWLREDFINKGFVPSDLTGEGATIFNVGAWSCGFSSATEIRSSSAVANYVSKYLTKTNIDPRFFNKRRYYTSHNCSRPVTVTDITKCTSFDPCLDFADLSYYNPKHYYSKYDSALDVIRARLNGLIPMPKNDLPFIT